MTSSSQESPTPGLLRAAQYVRMSTEHQQYSPVNQSDAIAKYAGIRDMEIVRTYADHGRSGLNLTGRVGLRALLDDVNDRHHDFSVVLVYDVSRWGRFQDVDESAYYEYVLKKAGVHVHYCAEQFINDGSLSSVLFKTLKRAMAGEYSRELSAKVFAGQSRLVELGYHLGGSAGYGLRRQLVDKDGNSKGFLGLLEQKSIHTDRVVLVPGPESEIAVVANIYRSFIALEKGETAIAADLNTQGVKTDLGRQWTRESVHQILINPKYIGVNLFNRRSFKLREKRVLNPPEMWIKRTQAFRQIVSTEDFRRVQAIIGSRYLCWNDKQMLDGLRNLLKTSGRLSALLIDADGSMPCSSAYARRFGGLARAYARVGWQSGHNLSFIEINRSLKRHQSALIDSIVEKMEGCGSTIRRASGHGLLTVNEEFTVSIRIARCHQRRYGHQWIIRFDRSQHADISVLVRLEAGNECILDYFVFPSAEIIEKHLRLTHHNRVAMDAYRFDDLKFFLALCRRTTIEGAA
jgi:DNA invertase Pin-like site-specific DNA recombinase